MKNNNSRTKRARRSRQRMPSCATSATIYRGPLNIPSSDSTIVALLDNTQVLTSAGGAISISYGNNPSAARNWAEHSTSWSEYRVIGMKITYDPLAVVNTAAIPGFSGYQCLIHSLTFTTPTTMAQAASVGVARPWSGFKRFTREWRMTDPEESLFQPTSAPSGNSFTFYLYGEGGGAAITYGNVLIEYLVQFKTHSV
jgi:hypothetical protein